MAYIELHQTLLRHRKTLRAVSILKVDRHKFVGHLVTLWCWALDNLPSDGDLGDMTDLEIARAAEWVEGRFQKKAAHFIETLQVVGFIDADENGRRLHDWYDYAGRLHEKRAYNRDRMRAARASNVQRTDDARAGATVPYRTVPSVPNGTVSISSAGASDDGHPEWYTTLQELPRFATPLAHARNWLQRRGVSEEKAEQTAIALKAKWGGKGWKNTDVWATFQDWCTRPSKFDMAQASSNGVKPLTIDDFPEPEPPRDDRQAHAAWAHERETWWQANRPRQPARARGP